MRLNLGAGSVKLAGWVGVDARPDADVRHDLSVYPWPFPDGEAREILASHVLEHFTRDDAGRFVRECLRVLAPGGALHLAVPDLDKFVDCHLSGDFSTLAGYHWIDLNALMGGGAAEPDPLQRHRYMWSEWSLLYVLLVCGFDTAIRRGPLEFDTPDYTAISLYVTARKAGYE